MDSLKIINQKDDVNPYFIDIAAIELEMNTNRNGPAAPIYALLAALNMTIQAIIQLEAATADLAAAIAQVQADAAKKQQEDLASIMKKIDDEMHQKKPDQNKLREYETEYNEHDTYWKSVEQQLSVPSDVVQNTVRNLPTEESQDIQNAQAPISQESFIANLLAK